MPITLTLHHKIDLVMNVLLNKKDNGFIITSDILKDLNNVSEIELKTILIFLEKDGFVLTVPVEQRSVKMEGAELKYVISVNGLLFIEKSSFINENKIVKRNQRFTISKTIINIINTIAILGIASYSIFISDNTNKLENTHKQDVKTIDSLKALNNKKNIVK